MPMDFESGTPAITRVALQLDDEFDINSTLKSYTSKIKGLASAVGKSGKEIANEFGESYEETLKSKIKDGTFVLRKELVNQFNGLMGQLETSLTTTLKGVNLNRYLAPLFESLSTEGITESVVKSMQEIVQEFRVLESMPEKMITQFSRQKAPAQSSAIRQWKEILRQQSEVEANGDRAAQRAAEETSSYNRSVSGIKKTYSKRLDRFKSDQSIDQMQARQGIQNVGTQKNRKVISEFNTLVGLMNMLDDEYTKLLETASSGELTSPQQEKALKRLFELAKDMQVVSTAAQETWGVLKDQFELKGIKINSFNAKLGPKGMEGLLSSTPRLASRAQQSWERNRVINTRIDRQDQYVNSHAMTRGDVNSAVQRQPEEKTKQSSTESGNVHSEKLAELQREEANAKKALDAALSHVTELQKESSSVGQNVDNVAKNIQYIIGKTDDVVGVFGTRFSQWMESNDPGVATEKNVFGTGVRAYTNLNQFSKADQSLPATAVDMSYYKTQVVNSIGMAEDISEYLADLEKYLMLSNKTYYEKDVIDLMGQEESSRIKKMDVSGLYERAKSLFGEEFNLTLEEFKKFISDMRSLLKTPRVDSDTGAISLRNNNYNTSSIPTRFLQLMGYEGVNTGQAETFNGKGEGSVIFGQVKPESIIKSWKWMSKLNQERTAFEEGLAKPIGNTPALDDAIQKAQIAQQNYEAAAKAAAEYKAYLESSPSSNVIPLDNLRPGDITGIGESEATTEDGSLATLNQKQQDIIASIQNKNEAFEHEAQVVHNTVDKENKDLDSQRNKLDGQAQYISELPKIELVSAGLGEEITKLNSHIEALKNIVTSKDSNVSIAFVDNIVEQIRQELDTKVIPFIKEKRDEIRRQFTFMLHVTGFPDNQQKEVQAEAERFRDALNEIFKDKYPNPFLGQTKGLKGYGENADKLVTSLTALSNQLADPSKLNFDSIKASIDVKNTNEGISAQIDGSGKQAEITKILNNIYVAVGGRKGGSSPSAKGNTETVNEIGKAITYLQKEVIPKQRKTGDQREYAFEGNLVKGVASKILESPEQGATPQSIHSSGVKELKELFNLVADLSAHSHPFKYAFPSVQQLYTDSSGKKAYKGDFWSAYTAPKGIKQTASVAENEYALFDVNQFRKKIDSIAKSAGMSADKLFTQIKAEVMQRMREYYFDLLPNNEPLKFDAPRSGKSESTNLNHYARSYLSYSDDGALSQDPQVKAARVQLQKDLQASWLNNFQQQLKAKNVDTTKIPRSFYTSLEKLQSSFLDELQPETLKGDKQATFGQLYDQWRQRAVKGQEGLFKLSANKETNVWDVINPKTNETLIPGLREILTQSVVGYTSRTVEEISKIFNVEPEVVSNQAERFQFAGRQASFDVYKKYGLDDAITWHSANEVSKQYSNSDIKSSKRGATNENVGDSSLSQIDRIASSFDRLLQNINKINNALIKITVDSDSQKAIKAVLTDLDTMASKIRTMPYIHLIASGGKNGELQNQMDQLGLIKSTIVNNGAQSLDYKIELSKSSLATFKESLEQFQSQISQEIASTVAINPVVGELTEEQRKKIQSISGKIKRDLEKASNVKFDDFVKNFASAIEAEKSKIGEQEAKIDELQGKLNNQFTNDLPVSISPIATTQDNNTSAVLNTPVRQEVVINNQGSNIKDEQSDFTQQKTVQANIVTSIKKKNEHLTKEGIIASRVVSSENNRFESLYSRLSEIIGILNNLPKKYQIQIAFSPTLPTILQNIQSLYSQLNTPVNASGANNIHLQVDLQGAEKQLDELKQQIYQWTIAEDKELQAWFDGLLLKLVDKATNAQVLDAIFDQLDKIGDTRVPVSNTDGREKERKTQTDVLFTQIQDYMNKKHLYAYIEPKLIRGFIGELRKQLDARLKEFKYKVSFEPDVSSVKGAKKQSANKTNNKPFNNAKNDRRKPNSSANQSSEPWEGEVLETGELVERVLKKDTEAANTFELASKKFQEEANKAYSAIGQIDKILLRNITHSGRSYRQEGSVSYHTQDENGQPTYWKTQQSLGYHIERDGRVKFEPRTTTTAEIDYEKTRVAREKESQQIAQGERLVEQAESQKRQAMQLTEKEIYEYIAALAKLQNMARTVLNQAGAAGVGNQTTDEQYNDVDSIVTLIDRLKAALSSDLTSVNADEVGNQFDLLKAKIEAARAELAQPIATGEQIQKVVDEVQHDWDSSLKNLMNWNNSTPIDRLSAEYTQEYNDQFEKINAQRSGDGTIPPVTPETRLSYQELTKEIDAFLAKLKEAGKSNYLLADTRQIQLLIEQINRFKFANTSMSKGMSDALDDLLAKLRPGLTQEAFNQFKAQFQDLRTEIIKTGQTGISFADRVKRKFKEIGAYQATYVSFYRVLAIFRQGFTVIQQFDSALTEMMKVSEETQSTLRSFQKTSFDQAISVGTTAVQIQNSTADFMRLGESLEEAAKSAVTANKLLAVSEFSSITEATEALTSMSQAYKEQDKDAIVDVVNELGNNYAISTDGVATALQLSASALRTAQNDLYEASALVTAGNTVIQDPNKVGAGLRTIALRLTGTSAAKAELQELGEDVDDFVMTTSSKLDKKIRGLTQVITDSGEKMSVSLLDANGNYRSTYEILQDIAKVWEQIGEEDKLTGENRQNALLELIAGKNRSNIAASILENPKILEQAYYSAINSEGSAENELNKYLDSIEGHVNQITTLWQEQWDNLNNRSLINGVLDQAAAVLKLVNNLGLLPSLGLVGGGAFGLKQLISYLTGGFGNTDFSKIIDSINRTKGALAAVQSGSSFFEQIFPANGKTLFGEGVTRESAKAFANLADEAFEFQKLSKGTQRVLISQQATNSAMTDEERDQLLIHLGQLPTLKKETGEYGKQVGQSKVLGTKLKGLGMTLKAHPYLVAITAVISALAALYLYIQHLQKQQEEMVKRAKDLTNELKEFQNTANQNLNTISSQDKSFQKQSAGVNGAGQNISLTDEQYQEYLNTCKQVASIMPEQISNYDAEGNAIIRLRDNVRSLSDAYKESVARQARELLSKGNDEGAKPKDIEDAYQNAMASDAAENLDFYTTLGEMASEEEFAAYIDGLKELRKEYMAGVGYATTPQQHAEWQASEAGVARQQLQMIQDALDAQNIDWNVLTEDYSKVSDDISLGQLKSVFQVDKEAAQDVIDESTNQVQTQLRTRLDASFDKLSDDEYNLLSQLLGNLSNEDIASMMNKKDNSTSRIMQALIGNLTELEGEGVDLSEIQKAITFKALSPKMSVSEQREVESQYASILKTLFGTMLGKSDIIESFGLNFASQQEHRIQFTAARFSLARGAAVSDTLQQMEELGIDTQYELGVFAETWADVWDATKRNWDEVIQTYLDRLTEESAFDWANTKEALDAIQTEIGEVGSMVQDVYVNPVDPEKIIDVMQTLGERGYSVSDYSSIDAALDAYYRHVREEMKKQLDDLGASDELKQQFQDLFDSAVDVNIFDQVSDLEKSLGNIQSAYDNVQKAMEEYNELGFLTMGTIDSLVALDDSYINSQVDQNGVLHYNADVFKQVALARIDEAKAAIWEETNSELVRIAHLNEQSAAQEQAKTNGTLSESAYRQARASLIQAQAAGALQRQLAGKVWEAANKRVALLDYQIAQVNNDTYDFGKASGSAASSSESSFGELFDFFERRIEVLEHAQSILEKSAELLEGSAAKNTLLTQSTGIVKEEFKNYTDALGMYTTAANFYFNQLDAEMQEKILNGSVDLKAMMGESGEAVNDLLESYVQWANKAQDCREKLIELRKELAQLELAKFKNIQQDYINQFDLFQGSIDNQDAQIALAEEAGELVGQAFYEEQRREATEQLRITTEEYTALQDQLNQSLQSGLIEEGSDEWLEMVKALQKVEEQSLSTEKQIVALNKSIRQQKWDTFARTMTEYENLGTELENLGELFNDQTDIEVSDGFLNWTEAATAQQGTLVQRYETSKQSIFAYQRAISDLNDEYAAGKWSTIEYNEKLWELKQGQWGAVESCEALEDAIMDMNEKAVDEAIERINDEIEAYQELTDAQKESLQAEKDLHDWQKKLTESNKNISDLERQLAAMQNDNTASTVAKRKKLEEELAEAKADLEEEEYQHSIDTQQDALDKQMEDYQKNREKEIEQLEESLKDRTKLIQQVFNWVLENAASIGLALEEIAKQNGINISTYITEPWAAGATALGGYSTVLTESTGAWATILEGISQAQIALQEQANGTGQAIVNESNQSKGSVWGLSQQLQDSYKDANNLKEACDAISDSAYTELEEGFSAENVVSALSAIETAAKSTAGAQGSIPDPSINFNVDYSPIGDAITQVIDDIEKITTDWDSQNAAKAAAVHARQVVDEVKAANREKAAANQHKNVKSQYGNVIGGKPTLSTRAKGGLITPGDNGTFDALARAVGEDTIIAAKYGESVLTPLQTEAMIKMAPFLETIASQLPDFSKAGRVGVPSVGSSSNNRSVQIGSLVTINGNVDDNNLKQIQQTVQTELRKSFNKINLDFKYA